MLPISTIMSAHQYRHAAHQYRHECPCAHVPSQVVYLEDTYADQGALRVVKGFHTRLASWDATQPANRSTLRPSAAAEAELLEHATPIAARAGSLVLWHALGPTLTALASS
jgi:ectoine hydroxylase-related dioxygenase (phytanoyl-CoA dioxygenase family)